MSRYEFEPTVTVDLNKVEKFINDPDFVGFMLEKTDYMVAAFVLQTLSNAYNKARAEVEGN